MQQCSENLTKCELQLLKRKYLKIHNVLFTICHMVFDKLLPHTCTKEREYRKWIKVKWLKWVIGSEIFQTGAQSQLHL